MKLLKLTLKSLLLSQLILTHAFAEVKELSMSLPHRKVYKASHQEVISIFKKSNKQVVTFIGFSSKGYELQEKVSQKIFHILSDLTNKFGKENIIVNVGGTSDGIGIVYDIAKSLNLRTSGIVSTLALKYPESISNNADTVYTIEDQTWGGFDDATKTLSPTSLAMVYSSNYVVAIGGDKIGYDELSTALSKKIPALVYAADMNHEKAINKAKKNNQPTPSEFKGLVEINLRS
jgi:hypothetical protein